MNSIIFNNYVKLIKLDPIFKIDETSNPRSYILFTDNNNYFYELDNDFTEMKICILYKKEKDRWYKSENRIEIQTISQLAELVNSVLPQDIINFIEEYTIEQIQELDTYKNFIFKYRGLVAAKNLNLL